MMQDEKYALLRSNLEVVRSSPVEITYADRFDETSDKWNFTLHHHDAIELIYFRSGKGKITVESEDVHISSYDVIVYPSGASHRESLAAAEHQEIICIHIRPIAGLVLDRPIHICDKSKSFQFLFNQVYSFSSEPAGPENLASDCARLLLLNCLREQMDTYENADFTDTVLSYIEDHYRENLVLSELSGLVHVSSAYLSRCFKERTGTTMAKYINRLRVEEACHLLKATVYPIEEVSRSAGFESPKYFSRIFKTFTGMTPSEYRHF